MSVFDTEAFLQQNQQVELDDHRTVVNANEYRAYITKVEARTGQFRKGPNVGQSYIALDVHFGIDDPDLQAQLNLSGPPTVRKSMLLDVDDNGNLLAGANRNVDLGMVRKAVGQNTGEAWYPKMLEGQGPVLIHVTERPDEKDPNKIYNDVGAVVAA